MQIIEKDGFQFTPVKVDNKLWTINLVLNGKPEVVASKGKTKKEATANFHKQAEKANLKEAVTYYKRKKVRKKFWYSDKIQDLFKHHFQIELNPFRCIYLSCPSLDIVKFDNWLRTPDNISTKQYITDKYGEQAMRLVNKLLCLKQNNA